MLLMSNKQNKNLVTKENKLGGSPLICLFVSPAWVARYADSRQCFGQQADNLVRNN